MMCTLIFPGKASYVLSTPSKALLNGDAARASLSRSGPCNAIDLASTEGGSNQCKLQQLRARPTSPVGVREQEPREQEPRAQPSHSHRGMCHRPRGATAEQRGQGEDAGSSWPRCVKIGALSLPAALHWVFASVLEKLEGTAAQAPCQESGGWGGRQGWRGAGSCRGQTQGGLCRTRRRGSQAAAGPVPASHRLARWPSGRASRPCQARLPKPWQVAASACLQVPHGVPHSCTTLPTRSHPSACVPLHLAYIIPSPVLPLTFSCCFFFVCFLLMSFLFFFLLS